ncbi:hypothetical protein HMSSN036_15240 [Paenibacillus macerans]|nr:hypothetical protein HMSSN036_15240 [Paenibacillus macerans]
MHGTLFLGTNAGVPSLERNVTSLALRLLEERRSLWLFDCGEGTQHQILRSPLKLSKLEYIFITHLHGDHLFGLPGLISSRAYQGGDSPLTLFGPKGLKKFVETTLGLSESRIDYKLEIVEHDGGLLFEDDTFRVEAALLEHRIASYGYRVVEKDLPGKLDAAVLERFGIRPGPLYGKLKKGESVVTPSGETLHAVDVLGKPKAGRIVTILGDTRPCSAAQKLAQNADVLVHESTFCMNWPTPRTHITTARLDKRRRPRAMPERSIYFLPISVRGTNPRNSSAGWRMRLKRFLLGRSWPGSMCCIRFGADAIGRAEKYFRESAGNDSRLQSLALRQGPVFFSFEGLRRQQARQDVFLTNSQKS